MKLVVEVLAVVNDTSVADGGKRLDYTTNTSVGDGGERLDYTAQRTWH